jgi:RNA-directed DNA polymerase
MGFIPVQLGAVVHPQWFIIAIINEAVKMKVKAKAVTQQGRHTRIEYARFADDLVILGNGF